MTSSQDLADRLVFSSAQIREYLSCFGGFGKQGAGYNVLFLQEQLRQILHIDQVWDVALIGVGDLTRARELSGLAQPGLFTLNVPTDVRVYYIDPVVGLQSLAYYLKLRARC